MRFNKLRFLKFLKKTETDQKYEETDRKFEETDQQTVIFKVFEKKAETDQKYEETDQKYWESPQIYLNKIKGKWIYNSGKSIKKGGNSSKFEFRGISEKFEEIAETSQKKPTFRGIHVFLIRFRVESFPCCASVPFI